MRQLHAIAEAEATVAELSIDFADQYCLDVSAYLVLGLMQQNMLPILSGGKISKAIRSMIDAVDLGRFLQVNVKERSPDDPTFVPFRLRLRRKARTSTSVSVAFQPSAAEKLSDELIDTINTWLALVRPIELTKTGKSYVSRMVSEVLDNAERHSDIETQDGDWAIAGFLSFVDIAEGSGVARNTFACSLAIASLGATIASSMAACEDESTSRDMARYIRLHSGHSKLTPETLATVFALQDGVSRFRQDDDVAKGGGWFDGYNLVR